MQLCESTGVRLGRGVDRKSESTATVAVDLCRELGVSERTARYRVAQDRAYDELPERLRGQVADGEKTLQQVRRAHKESAREANRQLVATAPTIEEALDRAKFGTITIDPPWDPGDEGEKGEGLYGRGSPPYVTMPLERMTALPVGRYADDDCHLYLWVTNRSLFQGQILLDARGFRYVTCITWCKPHFGLGMYYRGSGEHVLFGVRGSQPLKRRDVGTWFEAPRGPDVHSSKPVEFYDLVESCSPGPYLELFARGQREGWVCWGAELHSPPNNSPEASAC